MNKAKRYRLSLLAAAVGLAVGGASLAGDKDKDKYAEERADQSYQGETDYSVDRYGSDERAVADPDADRTVTADQSYPADRTPDDIQREDGAQGSDDAKRNTPAKMTAALLDGDTAAENDLGEFAAAVEKAGLTSALADGTKFTVFAPTDEAFEKFNEQNGDVSVEELRELLRSHIVAGKVDASQAKKLNSAKVLTGDTVKIHEVDDALEIGDAKVVNTDIASGNLTIHSIDTVLAADSYEDASSENAEEAE